MTSSSGEEMYWFVPRMCRGPTGPGVGGGRLHDRCHGSPCGGRRRKLPLWNVQGCVGRPGAGLRRTSPGRSSPELCGGWNKRSSGAAVCGRGEGQPVCRLSPSRTG